MTNELTSLYCRTANLPELGYGHTRGNCRKATKESARKDEEWDSDGTSETSMYTCRSVVSRDVRGLADGSAYMAPATG